MKHGENSPEVNWWDRLADKRAEEYLTRQSAERRKQYQEALEKLRRELGLKPGASLWEYVGLFPPGTHASSPMPQRDGEYIKQAIDDFFEKIGRVYADGEPWEQHFPGSKNGA